MNFSNMSPSHGLQFFTNCPSVGAVLQEQTALAWAPCEVTSAASKPAPAWGPLSPWVHRSRQEPEFPEIHRNSTLLHGVLFC